MSAKKKYDKGFLRDTYFVLCKTRYFEEAVTQVYQNGLMPGLSHVYLGEEAIATGACAAVEENDLLASTHRGHGHICARGADVNRMMAEIMGKADGRQYWQSDSNRPGRLCILSAQCTRRNSQRTVAYHRQLHHRAGDRPCQRAQVG